MKWHAHDPEPGVELVKLDLSAGLGLFFMLSFFNIYSSCLLNT